jgi:Gly-Xaa carboxypeptidase
LITDPFYNALIGTTQAIDLVQGGVKSNALPEEAWAVINHRIATQRSVCFAYISLFTVLIYTTHTSSVAAVRQRDRDVPKQLAREFNLTYTAFGSAISTEDGPGVGTLTLTEAWGTHLEPAPITPFGEDSAPWQLLSGTIKATFNAHRGLDGADNIFVSPGILTGNTGGCTLPVCLSSKQRLTI